MSNTLGFLLLNTVDTLQKDIEYRQLEYNSYSYSYSAILNLAKGFWKSFCLNLPHLQFLHQFSINTNLICIMWNTFWAFCKVFMLSLKWDKQLEGLTHVEDTSSVQHHHIRRDSINRMFYLFFYQVRVSLPSVILVGSLISVQMKKSNSWVKWKKLMNFLTFLPLYLTYLPRARRELSLELAECRE